MLPFMSENEKLRVVLSYDEEKDDFEQWPPKQEMQPDAYTYLIIDETESRMTISYRDGIGMVTKRTIERRVNSYSKSGFNMGDKRVGLGFPLEQVNAEEHLDPALLTHGHTYKKGRLVRDDIPAYAEKEDNYDVVSGIAGQKADVFTDPARYKTDVPSAMPPAQESSEHHEAKLAATATAPPKHTEVHATETETMVELNASSSSTQSSDDAVWALGQFVDQFARQGKVCVVTFEGPGKFRLLSLSDPKFKTTQKSVEGNYRVDNNNLFEI